jgi:divinyl protochlorophyllide a 8-vinyl-reductase
MVDVADDRAGFVLDPRGGGDTPVPASGVVSGDVSRERLAGVIGPNAVNQLAAALRDVVGSAETRQIFAAADGERFLDAPPGRMVDEGAVQRLYEVLDDWFDPDISELIAYDSGLRTAYYVARNRIPRVARWGIGVASPALGARLLLRAIVAHAWTFAGSGTVLASAGETVLIEITDNPLRTRQGSWHRGVLEGLFQGLVDRKLVCRYRAAVRDGRPVCRFEIHRCRRRARREGGVVG